jgi:hypothetical protein
LFEPVDADEEEEDIEEEDSEEEDYEEDDEPFPEMEDIVQSFTQRGYDVKDALSLLLCRYSKTDAKYTREYIGKLNDDFDEMMEELDNETQERAMFAEEDRNCLTEPSALTVLASAWTEMVSVDK